MARCSSIRRSRIIHISAAIRRTAWAIYEEPRVVTIAKRGIIGNYHKLSVEHLDRYLGEFCWRYNRRHQQPQLFDMALKNLAARKPLPYKDLTFETIFDLGRVK
jgi:hypothetical protein